MRSAGVYQRRASCSTWSPAMGSALGLRRLRGEPAAPPLVTDAQVSVIVESRVLLLTASVPHMSAAAAQSAIDAATKVLA